MTLLFDILLVESDAVHRLNPNSKYVVTIAMALDQ